MVSIFIFLCRSYILEWLELFITLLWNHCSVTFLDIILVIYTGILVKNIECFYIFGYGNLSNLATIFFIFWKLLHVILILGTQACWELVWGSYCFCWLVFLIQEQWIKRMYLNTFLLTHMTIQYSLRKIVQLARSQGYLSTLIIGVLNPLLL